MAAHYDAIVLGSGIGGLTTAVFLAKVRRQRVLVLEQHNIIGGFTHTFRRGKYEWDTGLHYVGNMGPNDFPRRVMDFVTNSEVVWRKMPEAFEHFHFPSFSFVQRAGEQNFRADLIARFPEEKLAIENYFRDLMRVQVWGTLHFAAQILPPILAWIPRAFAWFKRELGETQLKDYFDRHFRDERLKAILTGPCGDYGLPPSEASLFIHALIVRHYLEGGYYPEGGSGRLPKAIKKHLKDLGVEVLTRHEATQILTRGRKVEGVRATSPTGEKTFFAPMIVSAIGARQTYQRLLTGSIGQEVSAFRSGMTIATIYLGLKESPARFGFNGENHWLFSSTDFELMHQLGQFPIRLCKAVTCLSLR